MHLTAGRRVERRTSGLALVAVALLLAALAAPAAAATAGPRTVLPTGTPDWATPAADLGRAAPADPVRLNVVLGLRDEAAATALALAVADPASAQYGQYLTPPEFHSRFAPTDAQLAGVRQWLEAAGLRVGDVPANHRFVPATGTVAQAEAAFATRLDRYAPASTVGRVVRAPAAAVTVPASLAGVVVGVGGLHDSPRSSSPRTSSPQPGGAGDANAVDRGEATAAVPPPATGDQAPPPDAFVNARPCSAYWGEQLATGLPKAYGQVQPYAPCGYLPSQLQGAYGVAALAAAGIDGSGVTVAITDAYASPTVLADANSYATRHGQPAFAPGQFNQVTPPAYRRGFADPAGDTCTERGWYGEETLDVEAVHALAPGANVLYVAGASCDDSDLVAALNTIVDGHLAQIISNSWGGVGEPNPKLDSDLLHSYQQTFVQAVLQGIGVFFSSGDGGDEVDNTTPPSRTPDFPASHPLVTAVGGTSLAVSADQRRLFETGWGTARTVLGADGASWDPTPPGPHLYGGGGGTSRLYDEPGYQRSVVPGRLAEYFPGHRGRVVPDVAAVGDPNTGMLIGITQTWPDGSTGYGEYRIGGTSLASPVVAGIEAISDQAYGRAHGFANPAIYRLAGTAAVHDIVDPAKTLAVVRVDYLNMVDAGAGRRTTLRTLNQTQTLHTRVEYDDVTGVGTPNGLAFVNNLGY